MKSNLLVLKNERFFKKVIYMNLNFYDFKHDESMIWGTSFFNKPHKSNLINVIQCDNTMNLKCLLSESLELHT